ncbi:hypothetical protein ARTHROSP310_15720 [Arthrobacter sp. AD-310]
MNPTTANHIHKGTSMEHLLPVSSYQLEVSPGHCLACSPEGAGASVLTMNGGRGYSPPEKQVKQSTTGLATVRGGFIERRSGRRHKRLRQPGRAQEARVAGL